MNAKMKALMSKAKSKSMVTDTGETMESRENRKAMIRGMKKK